MTISKIKLLALSLGMFLGQVSASPTSNEFVPCKKLAVAKLKYCLNDDNENCWAKSKASYEACYKNVLASHSVKNNKINKAQSNSDTIKK
ncbi:hypothetical protein [Paraglaciecola sp. 2405UD69-4]|uniref:hypothetical protein n=1 Tax=Paraglaciecola sp. 2405UD69-4 TaxID=3391836 RepID=UPI0039C9D3EE